MNRFIYPFYRLVVPKPLRTSILKKSLRKKIINQLSSLPDEEVNVEQKEVLEYLENNQIRIFPYPFQENYSPDRIGVFYDRERGMRYVLHEGKRLYFKRRWSEKRIRNAYSELLKEQDPASPHRYLSDDFTIGENDVLADIGAAEGNFSLAVIERIRKVYLFEYDTEWIEALEATFSPWPGKVEIINKYVAGRDDQSHIRFDSFYGTNNDITFLKIDVDGAEADVLESCRDVFNGNLHLKVALCTYHRNNDEREFTRMLAGWGFRVTPSKGYMIYYYDKKIKAPWLRRGLVRAVR
jgi:hypothetical protein